MTDSDPKLFEPKERHEIEDVLIGREFALIYWDGIQDKHYLSFLDGKVWRDGVPGAPYIISGNENTRFFLTESDSINKFPDSLALKYSEEGDAKLCLLNRVREESWSYLVEVHPVNLLYTLDALLARAENK